MAGMGETSVRVSPGLRLYESRVIVWEGFPESHPARNTGLPPAQELRMQARCGYEVE